MDQKWSFVVFKEQEKDPDTGKVLRGSDEVRDAVKNFLNKRHLKPEQVKINETEGIAVKHIITIFYCQ